MQQTAIHALNGAYLVIIAIGIPAITSREFGPLTLTSNPDARMLTFWGLGLACGLNLAGLLWLARSKKAREACRIWVLVHGAVLAVEFLLYRKQIHFNWLKDGLLWIKQKFSR